jgi:hypothetical protein
LIELRAMQHTRTAVCVSCCSVLDATTPSLVVLSKFDAKMRVMPLIPLGARGAWHGAPYEVIGFQQRTIYVEGVAYSWQEYLLFNPYRGFRYLTHYNGHWNDVETVRALPAFTAVSGHRAASFNNTQYRHFQHAQAFTTFVMGEFPWAVKAGEAADCDDYVAPPYMLSSEMSEGEINWSHGVYVEGKQVFAAFQMKTAPPPAQGIFANQPTPYAGKTAQAWRTFLLLLVVWAVVLGWFTFFRSNKVVYEASYKFAQAQPGEHSLVTPVFEVPGRRSNLEVELRTDLNNNWAYFNLALLKEDGSIGYDFGREVSYYSGRDSDGNWTEGKAKDSVILPRVEAGRYYLRIEPEMDPEASRTAASGMSMNYDVRVIRDVPQTFLIWLALPLLIIPPVWTWIKSASFEGRRWAESDYAGSSDSSSDSDDSGDDD